MMLFRAVFRHALMPLFSLLRYYITLPFRRYHVAIESADTRFYAIMNVIKCLCDADAMSV